LLEEAVVAHMMAVALALADLGLELLLLLAALLL
jgi:hypothetical protein